MTEEQQRAHDELMLKNVRDEFRKDAQEAQAQGQDVFVEYTNYKGEHGTRHIVPLGHIGFKSTKHHPEPQWMLLVWDFDKDDVREFAMKDVSNWRKA
jgi:predicted DNA-binding transcriptional regulator YafY